MVETVENRDYDIFYSVQSLKLRIAGSQSHDFVLFFIISHCNFCEVKYKLLTNCFHTE